MMVTDKKMARSAIGDSDCLPCRCRNISRARCTPGGCCRWEWQTVAQQGILPKAASQHVLKQGESELNVARSAVGAGNCRGDLRLALKVLLKEAEVPIDGVVERRTNLVETFEWEISVHNTDAEIALSHEPIDGANAEEVDDRKEDTDNDDPDEEGRAGAVVGHWRDSVGSTR